MTAALQEALSPTAAVLNAAVEIIDEQGKHAGVGLALELPDRGSVILTCHHVVASIMPGKVLVRFRGGDSQEATLDAAATRVERDTAVLTVADPPTVQNPRLHAPRPQDFHGPVDALAYSPGGETSRFKLTLESDDENRVINVPYEPRRYVLPSVFLTSTTESRGGVSGSPVLSESGVWGLVHAARPEAKDAARAAFVGPIHAWLEGLPELEPLIQPYVTQDFRDHAAVFWAAAAPERRELYLPGRPGPYIERPEDEAARRAFENGKLYLVGRHNSGKTRLVRQLLLDNPGAIVVLPDQDEPPPSLQKEFDARSRPVILVFDNAHVAASAWRPLQWWLRFKRVNRRTTLVLTTWNEGHWVQVKEEQRDLFEAAQAEPVYLSKDEGENLDAAAAWQLAQELGMDRETFEQRFDGTPGSLLVDEDAPPPPGEVLPDGNLAGIAIIRGSTGEVATNLPDLTSSFVGRERELGTLEEMLERSALISLTGPPGIGKTRLAVHFARTHAASFVDGVWFVDLSQTRDQRQVLDIIGMSVEAGRRARSEGEGALVERLRRQRALLILNGPDDIREVIARLAGKLTEDDPPLRLLVTVEAPLGIDAEKVLPLDSLSATDAAQRLFIDRSGLAAADQKVKPFVEALGGNAAALEIAGAQVRATGLQRAAEARERRPALGAEDVLRLAVMSSLEDIASAEAVVFMRLGAMPDWFTLQAARAVVAGVEVEAADVPNHLRALVDRALLLIDEREEEQRYRMLPSVAEIAAQQLELSRELKGVRHRHAAYFMRLAEDAGRRLQGRSARKWLAKLEADQQHLRAALGWAIDNDRSTALRLCSALWMPCILRGNFTEGRRWIGKMADAVLPELMELSPDEVYWLADALTGGAYLAYHQGDYADAERRVADARRVRDRPGGGTGHGDTENLRGLIARRRGDFEAALQLVKRAADVNKLEGDMSRFADRLNTIGNVLRESSGDLDKAERKQRRSLAIYARLGDVRGAAMAQCDHAYIRLDRQDYEEARRLFEESLATRVQVRDKQGEAQSLNGLGILERERGRADSAVPRHKQALEIFGRIGDVLRVAESRESLGLALFAAGHAAEGREHLNEAEAVRDRLGAPRPPVLREAVDRTLAAARSGRFGREAPVATEES